MNFKDYEKYKKDISRLKALSSIKKNGNISWQDWEKIQLEIKETKDAINSYRSSRGWISLENIFDDEEPT